MFNHISVNVFEEIVQNEMYYGQFCDNGEVVPGIGLSKQGDIFRVSFKSSNMVRSCDSVEGVVSLIHRASSTTCKLCKKLLCGVFDKKCPSICADCFSFGLNAVLHPPSDDKCCICLEPYSDKVESLVEVPIHFDCERHIGHMGCIALFKPERYACPMRCPHSPPFQ